MFEVMKKLSLQYASGKGEECEFSQLEFLFSALFPRLDERILLIPMDFFHFSSLFSFFCDLGVDWLRWSD